MHKAREEGSFAVSKEFVAALQFAVLLMLLGSWGSSWATQFMQTARGLLRHAFEVELGPAEVVRLVGYLLSRVFAPLGTAGALLVAATLALQFAVTGGGLSLSKFGIKFDKLNPANKLRELPRQNLTAVAQASVVLVLFTGVVYYIARSNIDGLLLLPLAHLDVGLARVWSAVRELLWKATAVFLVLGAIDLIRQKRKYKQDLRMTRQEVRDELKESEGNPQIKGRIRQLRRDLLRRRMMSEVPTATAVIVNPTHFAVAIRYRHESMSAPLVVAKGKNFLALRIRQKAVESHVPLVENPPLAQALYKSVEVGQEIPPHLYRAVAEILAYIYKLMHTRLRVG